MKQHTITVPGLAEGLSEACRRSGAVALARGTVLLDIEATEDLLAVPYRQELPQLGSGVVLHVVHRTQGAKNTHESRPNTALVRVRVTPWGDTASCGDVPAQTLSSFVIVVTEPYPGVSQEDNLGALKGREPGDMLAMAAMLD